MVGEGARDLGGTLDLSPQWLEDELSEFPAREEEGLLPGSWVSVPGAGRRCTSGGGMLSRLLRAGSWVCTISCTVAGFQASSIVRLLSSGLVSMWLRSISCCIWGVAHQVRVGHHVLDQRLLHDLHLRIGLQLSLPLLLMKLAEARPRLPGRGGPHR